MVIWAEAGPILREVVHPVINSLLSNEGGEMALSPAAVKTCEKFTTEHIQCHCVYPQEESAVTHSIAESLELWNDPAVNMDFRLEDPEGLFSSILRLSLESQKSGVLHSHPPHTACCLPVPALTLLALPSQYVRSPL